MTIIADHASDLWAVSGKNLLTLYILKING